GQGENVLSCPRGVLSKPGLERRLEGVGGLSDDPGRVGAVLHGDGVARRCRRPAVAAGWFGRGTHSPTVIAVTCNYVDTFGRSSAVFVGPAGRARIVLWTVTRLARWSPAPN